ncbi:phage gp6-like head-tail connector protein, partial [Salmonella enterica subsp. enterica serovar Florida]|nr:phage gp6-like head-tail connector protein [Salmonella enterica]ECD4441898.1 phage gp6-like head-tail connector protein [Salmonella enterica subsp. enterica serovar Florida]EEG1560866.1 phage gp6-like head-tail connector protein [Salmonella enterica subsp. enterica serovar Midway]EAS2246236.1 phage gp6-like head-tail connector protein [Salmonella enterica]EAX7378614.1 phage gp6-like head-tail connector protein [Salmonella enterica]
MLLLIGHWYANRESVAVGQNATDVPFAVEALLQPYRIYGV